MKRFVFLSLLLLSVFYAIEAEAANWYVRSNGGSYGSGTGTDWNNAFSGFSSIPWDTVSCGDTIWIAGGTYTQGLYPSKDCTSGSQLYIRRARSDASGSTSAAGWSSGFDSLIAHNPGGTGITFSGTGSYVTISGRTATSGGGYGWKLSRPGITVGRGVDFSNSSLTDHITIEYMDIAGPTVEPTDDLRGIDNTPLTGGRNTNSLFSHLKIHGWGTGIYAVFVDNVVFEYIDMYDINGNTIEHANLFYIKSTQGGIIRYSQFHDSMANGTGIAFSDLDMGGASDWQVYGNLFYDMDTESGAAIGIQDALMPGLKIFNNTFSNNVINLNTSGGGGCGPGSESRNNIVHGSGGSVNCGTTSNNLTTGSNIFVNRASADFRIVPTVGSGYPRNVGTSLSAYFLTGIDGTMFGADGAWDVGAYEAGATSSSTPSAPVNLSVR